MSRARLFFITAFLGVTLSCGGDSTGPQQAAVATVTVNPGSATIGPTATVQLSAVPKDNKGNALNGRAVTWSSGTEAVATVSSDGLVTAKGLGAATITATVEGKSGIAAITVAASVARVGVTPAADTLFAGTGLVLTATAYDSAGAVLSGRQVSWSSSQPTIAQVTGTSSQGDVTGNAAGSVTITATIEGAKDSALLEVQRVDLNGTWDYTERIGRGQAFVCSDTGSYAFVQASNTFTGLVQQVGRCGPPTSDNADSGLASAGIIQGNTITFSVEGCDYTGTVAKAQRYVSGTASCIGGYYFGTWKARPADPLADVAVAPGSLDLVKGGSAQLVAQLRDTIGNRVFFRPVTWSSDNGAAASVDANGLVSGAATGSATIGATAEGLSSTATVNVIVVAFASVVPGTGHTCGLTGAGAAYCWGFNGGGQGGNGTRNTPQQAPFRVSGGHTWSEVRAGFDHSCGVATGGTGYCWGLDGDGRAGDGTATAILLEPTSVSGGLAFTTIRPGWVHSCGLSAGTAYCWGGNGEGQLGTGDLDQRLSPTAVNSGQSFTQVAVGMGFSSTSCALTAAGAAYCWGANGAGQAGVGSTSPAVVISPAPVVGGHTFTSLVIGQLHACGLTAAGTVYCWGSNALSQFGDGTTTDHLSPSVAAGGMTFVAIGAGNAFTCGLTSGGTAYCWGTNEYGELGRGTIGGDPVLDSLGAPRLVIGGLTFASIEVGGFHVCGITTGSDTYCWGVNIDGQLGDGTRTDNGTPRLVLGQAASAPPPVGAAVAMPWPAGEKIPSVRSDGLMSSLVSNRLRKN